RVLAHVTVAAEQLQASVDYLALLFGEPPLGHRRRAVVELTAQVPFDARVEEYPRHVGLGLALGQDELGVLEVEDGLVECVSRFCVGDGLGHGGFHRHDRANPDREPLLRELSHQLRKTCAKPLPSTPPRTCSTGTRTSSKDSSEVSAPCW